jgi:hypothetical protein
LKFVACSERSGSFSPALNVGNWVAYRRKTMALNYESKNRLFFMFKLVAGKFFKIVGLGQQVSRHSS